MEIEECNEGFMFGNGDIDSLIDEYFQDYTDEVYQDEIFLNEEDFLIRSPELQLRLLMRTLENEMFECRDDISLKLLMSKFLEDFSRGTGEYDLAGAFGEFTKIVETFEHDETELRKIKLYDMINNTNRNRFKLMMVAFTMLFASSMDQLDVVSEFIVDLENINEDDLTEFDEGSFDYYTFEDEEFFISNIEDKLDYLLKVPIQAKNGFVRELLDCSKSTVPRLKAIRRYPYSKSNLELYSNKLDDAVRDIKENGYNFNKGSDTRDVRLDNKFKEKLKEYGKTEMRFCDVGISEVLMDIINVNDSFITDKLKRKIITNINRALR